MTRGIRSIASKWRKTKALLKDRNMRQYVPNTRALTSASLRDMLRTYGMAYVKPDVGTRGSGVMRIERMKAGGTERYMLHSERTKRTFGHFDAMYRSLLARKKKPAYLVQKGIRLLKHYGRPIDIRVMVQRDARKKWVTTGIIARIAAPGKIVTNYHNGGQPIALEKIMEPKIGASAAKAFKTRLGMLGKDAAVALSRTYPSFDSIGADIGVDASLHPWILEVNTRPDPYIFKHLKNPKAYRRILGYARALRRIK